MFKRPGQQRSQTLHTNQDIPANALGVRDHRVILVTHHMAATLYLGHQIKLLNDLLHGTVKVLGQILLVHALIQSHLQFCLILRHRDHFEGRFVGMAKVVSLNAKYLAKASFSYFFFDDPVSKNHVTNLVVTVHRSVSLSIVSVLSSHHG